MMTKHSVMTRYFPVLVTVKQYPAHERIKALHSLIIARTPAIHIKHNNYND